MGVLIILVIVFFLVVGFMNPPSKLESAEERHRKNMIRYANMPLKEYWRVVEHEITYERFTNDGKLEWKQSVLRWRGDPKKERYINLISVRANIERLDMDMPLDEYAMFYFGRLVNEHGEEWYVKHENRPYHMLEYESLELFDADGNQYHYFMFDSYDKNDLGSLINYVYVNKLIRNGDKCDCQKIGRVYIHKSDEQSI